MTDIDTRAAAGTDERLAGLSPARQALLRLRLRAEAAPAAGAIPRRASAEPAPLSFAQRSLWLLDEVGDAGAAYNVVEALDLAGPLDVEALERALGAVVRRHDTLRTRIATIEGEPVQVVGANAERFPLPVVHCATTEEADRLLEETAHRPFVLADGPLLRALLVRVAPAEHRLLLVVHHVVSDAWSMEVLFREVAEVYRSLVEGGEPALPPLEVQYGDYAAWQRVRLQDDALGTLVAYWRGHLEDAPAVLPLPADRLRPAVRSHAGARHSLALPPELAAAAAALGRAHGATPFMVHLAAFAVVLGRWSGEERVVVGTPFGGRGRAELEPLIGFFVNTLPLRTDLSGDPDFLALLGRVRAATLGGHAHQELPMESLVEALDPERVPGHSPLFQVAFAMDGAAPPLPLAGLRTRRRELASTTSKFDLTLSIREEGDTLRASFTYATALFDAATVDRLAGHYLAVLRAAVAAPEVRLSRIDLVSPAERRTLLAEWSGTEAPRPAAAIPQQVAARAAAHPGAAAVVHGAETLTFGDLDTRANRLAHALRARGAGPGAPVAVHLDRTPDLVVALLAAMKSGAPYLPLDPAYPAERLTWMLEDSGASILVTTASLSASSAPPRETRSIVRLDADAAEIAQHPPTPPDVHLDLDSLAYVVYTSGSTGTPKGVAVPHRGLANLAAWQAAEFGIGSADRASQVAAPGFDAFAWEVWPALAQGAAVDLVPPEVRLDPAVLRDWLTERGVTHAFLPTPLAEGVLALEWCPDAELRVLYAGGDRLHAHPAPGLPFALVNLYGPTECTVVATWARVEPGPAEALPPSIGRAVANARAYVLDAHGALAPAGVAGELYLGGEGVARGYLGRTRLTAERFVPDPFGGRPGARLYRTGDRVRWRSSGELEFLGRTDQQVKVRGFRIEPGEIEAALHALPGVAEAVVVARGAGDDRRLVAYVVAGEGAAAGPRALRDALRQRLPEHMVPSVFVALERLPLTANGKVDHRALPEPGVAEAAAEDAAHAAPRTPTEAALTAIWAAVLGVERVGVHDDFFRMGGHSLRAMQVVSRIRRECGAELAVRTLFDNPTPAALAEQVDRARPAADDALAPRDRLTPAPLSFAQERLWFLDRLEPGSTLYNVPAALELRGALDAEALERSLAEVVRRHEALRTRFPLVRGEAVQAVAPPPAHLPLPRVRAAGADRGARRADALRRVEAEAWRPFDLAEGPLFRTLLVRVDGDEHLLLVAMHHTVSDGWSMGVLFREIEALYAGEALPPLAVQYADFAVWQRRRLRGAALEAGLAYWRAHLEGAPPVLSLPTDHPRPDVATHRGAAVEVALPPPLSAAVSALAHREGATPFMVLLAAYAHLLGRWSGEERVVVGTAVAARTHAELEPLIGFFTNMLALRTDLSGDPTFRELLARVREATLGGQAHQEIPFEKLVEELHPERSLGHTPLFQVVFSLDAAPRLPRLAGVEARRARTGHPVAKFDLNLSLREHPEGIRGILEYATDLFERETVEALGAELRRLLEAVTADPARPLSTLPLTEAALRTQLRAAPAAAPEPEPAPTGDGYVAPRTELEGRLAALWARVLEVDRVGVNDSFFDLGGHSLLLVRLHRELTAELGHAIPIVELFRAPTVHALATFLLAGSDPASARGRGREKGDARRSARQRRARRPHATAREDEPMTTAAPAPAPDLQDPREEGEEVYTFPLSFAQQRLWFLEQMEPGGSHYVIPAVLELAGTLDVPALERSLAAVVARHEALRTRIRVVDGEPAQVIPHAVGPWTLRTIDLATLPEEAREAELDRLVRESATRPFALGTEFPLRGLLVRMGPRLHHLLLILHHIAADAWSLGVLFREMGTLYEASLAGREVELPPLEIQYADYAVWQRDHLRGEVLEREIGFWRAQLDGAPALLALPADLPRPPVQSHAGAFLPFRLSRELTDALKATARREGSTLFMVLLAAFQALLGRYARQDRVVVGTPIAGRDRAELEPLIGFFVNTLALHTDLGGDATFRDVLARVRETTLGAYAHQQLPFEKLVEELHPERSLAWTPVFQVMFVLQNAPIDLRLPGIELGPGRGENRTAKYDLSLDVGEWAGGMSGGFNYCTDLFQPHTVERIGEHLRALLETVAADPGVRLADAFPTGEPAPPAAAEWYEAARGTVSALVAGQAAATPDAPAVLVEGGAVSHRELEARANRLAHALRRLGVGPERRVGVALDPGPDVLVALLAILRAGGTYLPLDPAYPSERTAFLLADADAVAVVTTDALAPSLPATGAPVLRLDANRAAIEAEPDGAPAVEVAPESAAYLLYTSGSTGEPKGVVVSHGAAAAHLRAAARAQGLTPADRVLVFAAISFDPSIEQMLAPLAAGAAVAFRGPETWSPTAFAERVEALGITVANPPTAYWHALAEDAGARARVRSALRIVTSGGEAMRPETVAAWHREPGGAELVNAYGPTEGVVTSTVHRTTAGDGAVARVPIGAAIGGRTVHLLDARLRPVAPGLPGEIFLGGPALARGYLGRPALTAERFLPDPFAGRPGARLYRTGDLARRLPSGELDFLGRADGQVKIRGFRVEPGEVEAAIRALPAIADAAVAARDDGAGTRLVAYLVPAAGAEADPAAVRAALAGRLPEYLVPAAFVVLDRLPITGGKVDRAALPAPEAPAADAARTAPGGAFEEELVRIWREVLGVPEVGVNDNFFDLGGHSLLLARVHTRIREELRREVPIVELFRSPTVRALAAFLGGDRETAAPGRAHEKADTRRSAMQRRRERRAHT